jgi:CDP-diacylglycerol--glycerol-3-phosphate 3-phosphatidyltransferase
MHIRPSTRARWRHLPNAISLARVLAVPVLVLLAAGGHETAFKWVLVPALLSDIVDGWIARALAVESKLGAFLDSVGDTLLWFVSVYGIWVFHREVITGNAVICGFTMGLWALEYALALLRYGRLSSFHTYLAKIAGYGLGIYVGVLFVFGHYPWLLYLACGASILGNLEEFALLALLPQWRADVGSVLRILRERRRGAAR